MDFDGNLSRIVESIEQAKRAGAKIRLGPELEICGYSCEDHFFENDTLAHCWESLAQILSSDLTDNILCDFGMPVLHENVRYNCRVICLNRKILLIRPKMCLADEGNYRESRWFTAWSRSFTLTQYYLPGVARTVTGQDRVPFGVGLVSLADTVYGVEICEELFTANNPGITLGLSGAEIIGNGSGSHFGIRKRTRRLELIEEQTKKNGGVYMYSNQKGCDGSRLFFDGSSLVCINGETVAIGQQFGIFDVEVVVATVALVDVRNHRSGIPSRGIQAMSAPSVPRVEALYFNVTTPRQSLVTPVTLALPTGSVRQFVEAEEFGYSAASYLWDYLRRSNMPGYFLALSGGVDSAASAACVSIMCQMLMDKIDAGDSKTYDELCRTVRDRDFAPKTHKDIANKLFFCVYMGTIYSTGETFNRASALASEIGCTFANMDIEPIVKSFGEVYAKTFQHELDISRQNSQENIACQNIQARSRMVMAYLCAQMLPVTGQREKRWPGSLLVLGSGNLDEAYRGYFTKYDCSSADINPIGGCGKILLRSFLSWAAVAKGMPTLAVIGEASSSSELQPRKQNQTPEEEMGFTFDELHLFGRLRMNRRCAPVSMFHRLREVWHNVPLPVIAEKVKRFFRYYSFNRHKVTTLPPAMHVESSSCDDNRYDLRPFLYNADWSRQFRVIDATVEEEARFEEADAPNHSP